MSGPAATASEGGEPQAWLAPAPTAPEGSVSPPDVLRVPVESKVRKLTWPFRLVSALVPSAPFPPRGCFLADLLPSSPGGAMVFTAYLSILLGGVNPFFFT